MFHKLFFMLHIVALVLCLHPIILSVEGQEALLVSHKNDILLLENNTTYTVVSADSTVVAFDVHQVWRQIYWATPHSIFRTSLYDLDTTTLVAVAERVGTLVVDWVHHQVYWTDLTAARIEAAHLDGMGRRVVYEAEWAIGALAIDPDIGKLFWIERSQVGQNVSRIKTSNFDGSHTKTICISENIYEKTPLALDLVYKSIYFFKIFGNNSEQWQIHYEGIEPHIRLLSREEPPARSLSLTRNGFFYSNRNGLSSVTWFKRRYTLFYDNKTNDFVILEPFFRVVNETLMDASQIHVMSEAAQPRWEDKCGYHLCHQKCVPGTHTQTCACTFGYTLGSDLKTCSEDGYIFYSTRSCFGRIKLNGEEHTFLFNESSSTIQTFDIHVKLGYVYWSDLLHRAIYRAPVELPTRKHIVVADVAAYGVAVDWLHGHIYWSDDSSIWVSSLDGDHQMVLLKDLDDPAEITVDPINRLIFWAECGQSLSVQRAGLDGSHVTTVVGHVTCGASLSAEPITSTLYWLDWTGTIHSCGYDGSRVNLLFNESAGAMTILDQQVLWTPVGEGVMLSSPRNDATSDVQFNLITHDVKPTALRVVKSSQQPLGPNLCADSDCPGLCLPPQDTTVPPLCACPDQHDAAAPCTTRDVTSRITKAAKHKDYLVVLGTSPFSVTLRCSGVLLTHPVIAPYIHVSEVASLVPRDNVIKHSRVVKVANKSLPFTIDSLNPATTYLMTVRNRVTKAAFSIIAHTPPPPMAVKRLPVVTVPGVKAPLTWLPQGIHYFTPNVWEDLVHKELVLLLISETTYSQSDFPALQPAVEQLIKRQVKDNFIILNYYNNEEEFDDDPAMYLGNIPWGEEFWLAMVQVTEYKRSYNVDIVYSKRFALPDPNWDFLLEEILEDIR